MFWVLIAVLVVFVPVLLYAAGRRDESATMRDWDMLLSRRGQATLQAMTGRVEAELMMMDAVYDQSFRQREDGGLDEALRLLQAGYGMIEKYTPSMLRSLAAMAMLSRMVSAMAPLRPLRPKDFKASQLVKLAHLHRFVHHLAIASAERFRLRLHVLGYGFRLVRRMAMRATFREEPAWDEIELLRGDLRTLSGETVNSFRALLTSIDAEPARARLD